MRYPYRIWADIDHAALARNLSRIQARLAPHQGVILVVKADAYGHGAAAVARTAAASGVVMLGVGDSREAMEIVEAGVELPLLILGTIIDEEVADAARTGLHVGVHSSSRLEAFSREALRARCRLRLHLNIDTGLGRLGVPPAEAERVAARIHALPGIELAGLYTHFAHNRLPPCAESLAQERLFDETVARLRRECLLPRTALVHAASSGALFSGLGLRWDAVRPGLAAYGLMPPGMPPLAGLEPVLSLRSQVIFFKDVPAGTAIGYEGAWHARRPTRIATVPAGYNDGIPWRLGLGGRGSALLRGQRVPYAGRVSMDYLCLDIGDVPGAQIGDPVTLIGREGGHAITVQEMAAAAGTSPYEILCHMGKRVRRVPAGSPLERILP